MEDQIKNTILTIIKSDAHFLLKKIEGRKEDYLYVFSLQRSRDHYPAVFTNKFDSSTISELQTIDPSTISLIMDFYQSVEELKWYLMYTQDMPDKVDDKLTFSIAQLKRKLETVSMYIDVELGLVSVEDLENSHETPLELDSIDSDDEPLLSD